MDTPSTPPPSVTSERKTGVELIVGLITVLAAFFGAFLFFESRYVKKGDLTMQVYSAKTAFLKTTQEPSIIHPIHLDKDCLVLLTAKSEGNTLIAASDLQGITHTVSLAIDNDTVATNRDDTLRQGGGAHFINSVSHSMILKAGTHNFKAERALVSPHPSLTRNYGNLTFTINVIELASK